jgi:hypothetical protein
VATAAQQPLTPMIQRRSCRYPMRLWLRYQLLRDTKIVPIGIGRTVNISRTGILFLSDVRLSPGERIAFSIAWPAQRDSGVALTLCLVGRIVRADGDHVAATLCESRYSFRSEVETLTARSGTSSALADQTAFPRSRWCPKSAQTDQASRRGKLRLTGAIECR